MEYLLDNTWIVWLIVAVGCLIAELGMGSFYMFSFAFGALVSAVAALFGPPAVQVITFVVASLLGLALLRPFARRLFHSDEPLRPSNADALIGRIGRVTETIEPGGYGRVAIDGDDWKAQSDDDSPIEAGKRVEVIDRESIIIKVKQIN